MSAPKHTSGDWYVGPPAEDAAGPGRVASIWATDAEYPDMPHHIADVVRGVATTGNVDGECKANGRLLAAAPKLLAACRELLADHAAYLDDDRQMYPNYLNGRVKTIAAAIAAATGTES